MRDADNIRAVETLGIDWMGFIFWPGSARFVSDVPTYLPQHVSRVGVFVDSTEEEIIQHIQLFGLHGVQLHGHESPAFCRSLKTACGDSISLIKAFSIATAKDLEGTKPYEGLVDYFLFDTRSPLPGGSGRQFDWAILQDYNGSTPFLLSGGIGPEDDIRVRSFHHPRCIGIDLNSRFESALAHKDVTRLSHFLQSLNNQTL